MWVIYLLCAGNISNMKARHVAAGITPTIWTSIAIIIINKHIPDHTECIETIIALNCLISFEMRFITFPADVFLPTLFPKRRHCESDK